LSAVMGSWKIMAMCEPRRARMGSSGSVSKSRREPFEKKISPTARAAGGSNRIRARAVSDLPEPDSPTKPRTSRGARVKLRSRTAVRVWRCDGRGCPISAAGNEMVRLRTSSRGGTRVWYQRELTRARAPVPHSRFIVPESAAGHSCCCRSQPLCYLGFLRDFPWPRSLSTPAVAD
jgi:hypothetical protein